MVLYLFDFKLEGLTRMERSFSNHNTLTQQQFHLTISDIDQHNQIRHFWQDSFRCIQRQNPQVELLKLQILNHIRTMTFGYFQYNHYSNG